MSDDSIYRPFSKLVPIHVLGRRFDVPENNTLLRCFQYVAPQIPYGPFCWNGDCENDALCLRDAPGAPARSALACQTLVRSGMVIESLSPDLTRALFVALAKSEEAGVARGAAAGAGTSDEERAEPIPVGGPRRDP